MTKNLIEAIMWRVAQGAHHWRPWLDTYFRWEIEHHNGIAVKSRRRRNMHPNARSKRRNLNKGSNRSSGRSLRFHLPMLFCGGPWRIPSGLLPQKMVLLLLKRRFRIRMEWPTTNAHGIPANNLADLLRRPLSPTLLSMLLDQVTFISCTPRWAKPRQTKWRTVLGDLDAVGGDLAAPWFLLRPHLVVTELPPAPVQSMSLWPTKFLNRVNQNRPRSESGSQEGWKSSRTFLYSNDHHTLL